MPKNPTIEQPLFPPLCTGLCIKKDALMLDLYRILTILFSTEKAKSAVNPQDTLCPVQKLMQDFHQSEMIRLLTATAIHVRRELEIKEEYGPEVGDYILKSSNSKVRNLKLRDACSEIMHSQSFKFSADMSMVVVTQKAKTNNIEIVQYVCSCCKLMEYYGIEQYDDTYVEPIPV